ncbi:MAG: PIN domain-containing protein [Microbacteriaceae bacterium]
MGAIQKILPDANVLFSATTRNWLFLLKLTAMNKMFTVATTEDILAETIYSLRRKYPSMDGSQTRKISEKLRESSDYVIQDFDGSRDFPFADTADQHVHAAAIAGEVDILLSFDKGFLNANDKITEALPYEIMSPDQFFLLVDDSSPELVFTVAALQAEYVRAQRGIGVVKSLEQAGCPLFAERVNKRHFAALSGAIHTIHDFTQQTKQT